MSPFQSSDQPASKENPVVKFQCPCCYAWLGTLHANKNAAPSPCQYCGASVAAPAIITPASSQVAPAEEVVPVQEFNAVNTGSNPFAGAASAAPAPPAPLAQAQAQQAAAFYGAIPPDPAVQGGTPFPYHRN